MSNQTLVSIGIPTYNRPEGLARTLETITSQTFKDIEIIISDNFSDNSKVKEVIDNFKMKDGRINSYLQSTNIGAANNFEFVLEKASGNYFIWAADDDKWDGPDFLETLLKYAISNVLVFPDAVLTSNDGANEYPLKAYEKCNDRLDYTKVFCLNGVGHPIYGLFNLKLFKDLGLEFEFDRDLSYYNEGTFLHRLFLNAPVKYVKEAKIIYNNSIARSATQTQLNDFYKYFNRVILIYAQADLPNEIKSDLINEIFRNYESHFRDLISKIMSENDNKEIPAVDRIKKAVKVLLKGKL